MATLCEELALKYSRLTRFQPLFLLKSSTTGLAAPSEILVKIYVQLSDLSALGYICSATLYTCRPTLKDMRVTWTASGTNSDNDFVQAIAVAAKSPEHRPTRHVFSGLARSS